MIFWRKSGTLETLQPSMTTQSIMVRHQTKLSRAEPSKVIHNHILHCLQYFPLTRIECRLLRLVLVLHHSHVLSHFPWQKCKKQCFFSSRLFSRDKVSQREAMFKMQCGRGADGDGLVLELFKYGPPCLHACLVRIENEILCTGRFDSSWRHTLFTMVPKSGDLQQTKNWRPITILKITCTIFAKMLHDLLRPLLETEESMDQVVCDEVPVLTTRSRSLKQFAVKTLNGIPKFGLQAWIWPRLLTGLSIISYSKHCESNMFHSLTLVYWGRFTLLRVESSRVTSSAQCFFFKCCFGVCFAEIEGLMWASWHCHGSSRTADKNQVCGWSDVICPFLPSFGGDDWNLVMGTTSNWLAT